MLRARAAGWCGESGALGVCGLVALLLAGCDSGDADRGGTTLGGASGTGSAGSAGTSASAGTSNQETLPPYKGEPDAYFLTECIASCGQGLACVGGICSQACDSGDTSCGDLTPVSVCLEQTTAGGTVGACDVPCESVRSCKGASYCDLTINRCRAANVTGGGIDTLELVNGVRVVIDGEYSPRDVIIDDKYLYWTNSSAAIRRAPIDGGTRATLTVAHSLGNVAVRGDYVYFSDYLANDETGSVARVPRDGGELEELAIGVVPTSVALTDQRIYWADQGHSLSDGRINSARLDGSEPLTLAQGLSAPFGLTVAGGFVYFANGVDNCPAGSQSSPACAGGVMRLSIAGGVPERLDASNSASNLVATDAGVYWLRDESPAAVMFAPYSGAPRAVADIAQLGSGDLTLDGNALYWGSGDKLLRLPFGASSVERLLADRNLTRSAAVNADAVFVAESNRGRILAVPKDGSGNRPKGPIDGPCPQVIGDAGEMALSPRSDANLEALALSLEPTRIIASQATYDRVVADMTALRAQAPELASIEFIPPYDGSLNLDFSEVAVQSIESDRYAAWNCLNDFYGPMEMSAIGAAATPGRVRLRFQRRFNGELLAELYRQLPGVKDGEPGYSVGNSSRLAARRDGDHFEYFIRTNSVACGDTCSSPIDDPTARHFESTAAGVVTEP